MIILLRGVTYLKDIKTKNVSDLKQIARISMMVLYFGYSFEKCSTFSFNIFEISYATYYNNHLNVMHICNLKSFFQCKIYLVHHDRLGKLHKKTFLFQMLHHKKW